MSASVNQERERFEAWAQANGFGQSLPSTWAWQGWQAALSAGQATEPVGFIKEATEALLVEILDDDCDDLQSVRAIARTLRAAGLVIPEPPTVDSLEKDNYDLRLHVQRLTKARDDLLDRYEPIHPAPPVEVGVTVEPTDAQLHAAFDLDSGGPNPYYRCKSCGATEPGLREYLVAHYLRCKE